METVTCIEVIISIDEWNFLSFPNSGNFLSVHGNASMADYNSMSFFFSVGFSYEVTKAQWKRVRSVF
jgi:hypothetical protein